jgi:uncharacterized protein (DUF1499 family)
MAWQSVAIVVGSVLAAWILVLLWFRLSSRPPVSLGAPDGRLTPCPQTRNCVCTQDTDPRHRIGPLPFTGSPAEALASLSTLLARLPRVRIVSVTDSYLHAEFRSLLFRFVDDIEFLIDGAAKVIHFRSASRAGRSDLGVNRRRMEGIRRAFQAMTV